MRLGHSIKLDRNSELVYRGIGKYKLIDSGMILVPVNEMLYVEEGVSKDRRWQILF